MSEVTCPVCGGGATFSFLTREQVPVHQNLIMPTRLSATSIARGRLEMRCCEDCGFAFNHAFDASLLAYGDEYDNTQSHSPSFKSYMDELIEHMVVRRGVRGARIVEVGCGKGYFIHQLIEADAGNTGWGFDPSYVGPERALDGRLTFQREFYGPGCEELRADVVVCRHVIEHVADPIQLLETVRAALALSPDARVFFETPALDWILDNLVIWDFFYEHCSLFTSASLTTAFERAGFQVVEVVPTFGGQYLWLEARLTDKPSAPTRHPGAIGALARRFSIEEQRWIERWTTELRSSRSHGKVAIWGAGAKGVTFANLADPAGTLIDCIVDLNPHKQHRFLPGTGHPIVSPDELPGRGVTSAILMNPNYREENLELLRSSGLNIELKDHVLP